MRRRWAWGLAAVLVIGVTASRGLARDDDDEDTSQMKPPPRPAIRWSHYFAEMETYAQPKPGAKKPAAKPKKDTAKKPAETANAAPAKAEGGAPPADTSKMDQAQKEAAWKQWGDRLKAQQETIDLLTRELDVAQREYQIRAAAMYGDVGNRLRNSADWDKQDAQYKQQIADKQKALDDAKQKLEDLREEARKAGVPSSVREP